MLRAVGRRHNEQVRVWAFFSYKFHLWSLYENFLIFLTSFFPFCCRRFAALTLSQHSNPSPPFWLPFVWTRMLCATVEDGVDSCNGKDGCENSPHSCAHIFSEEKLYPNASLFCLQVTQVQKRLLLCNSCACYELFHFMQNIASKKLTPRRRRSERKKKQARKIPKSSANC